MKSIFRRIVLLGEGNVAFYGYGISADREALSMYNADMKCTVEEKRGQRGKKTSSV